MPHDINYLTREQAWAVVRKIRETLNDLPEDLKEKIFSVVVFGSLIRSDFIPGISDIDLLIVFKDETKSNEIETVIGRILDVAKDYYGCSNYEKVVDIVWIYENEIPFKGSRKKSIFKFLSIYAFDFVKFSKVIYGTDFIQEIEVPNPRDLIKDRVKRLYALLEQHKQQRNHYMIRILAGEAIRLAQITFGELTIDKRKVFNNFMKYVPKYPQKNFAKVVWDEYLRPPNKKKIDKDYIDKCIEFIKATLSFISCHV